MKVFISQPMHGKTEEEIFCERDFVAEAIRTAYPDKEIEIIDTYFKPDAPEGAGRIWYLGNSISLMDQADMIVFAPGWKNAKGCLVEYRVAELYWKNILEL